MDKKEEFRESLKPKTDIYIDDAEIAMLLGKDITSIKKSNKKSILKKPNTSTKVSNTKYTGNILTKEELSFLLGNSPKEENQIDER